MLVDSHCHLDRLDLAPFDDDFGRLMQATREAGVGHLLCVCIDLESYPAMYRLVEPWPWVSVSVGVHPNDRDRRDPTPEELVSLAADPRNVAIGETGLDYFRSEGDLEWQRQRFRNHIAAARAAGKPLIVHTRAAREDTIRVMTEEGARDTGGVMHCFTEDWEMAKQALDLGFYISFSGIVTFNSAADLREVAKRVPADRILVETDAPYLAPVPHRGKSNLPAYVALVAAFIAELRGVSPERLVEQTGENFFRLFRDASSD
ncbi:MAG TPA: TatD family deoxyribonuclease [Sedimenticola thiotaurini]|uniref:TatD family deoxyribonuclease n=1 Tax=Sedimenticola thiotaurini TaxID=1543721 RepID=A0A831RL98_9GAMM|nr:TatD family deoxyribonuclease [Sedimenticola thiotaurini]